MALRIGGQRCSGRAHRCDAFLPRPMPSAGGRRGCPPGHPHRCPPPDLLRRKRQAVWRWLHVLGEVQPLQLRLRAESVDRQGPGMPHDGNSWRQGSSKPLQQHCVAPKRTGTGVPEPPGLPLPSRRRAEVCAAVAAGACHVGHEPTELLGVGGLHQRQILELPQVLTLPKAFKRKQLRASTPRQVRRAIEHGTVF